MTETFWALLFVIIYCYFLYPLIIFLLARFKPRTVQKASIEPAVSVVISLHNEQDVIAAKIENLLKLDYPAGKLEILIGSDGSTDRTADIIRQFSDPRVKLFINPIRQGKMATINGLMAQATGEIIFFTDARQLVETDALRKLVSNFTDPAVGCASGELVFAPKDAGLAKGVNLYWNYEKFIRYHEGLIHSMLGATGAIYAIRRALFVPGEAQVVLDDMFIPFKIIQKGYRAVFDETAHAYDQVAANPAEEFRRKTRTIYGNYQIFALLPGMFNPLRSPVAFQLLSHKFLRLIIPFLLIVLFMINFKLRQAPIFNFFLILQIVFYTAAAAGHWARRYKKGPFNFIDKICGVPYVFCLLNYSALVGFARFIFAKQQSTWQKARDI